MGSWHICRTENQQAFRRKNGKQNGRRKACEIFLVFFFSLGVDENPRLSIDTTLHCTDTEFSYTRDESRGKPTATIGERVRPALSLPPDSLSLDPEVIPTEMLWIPGSWGD